MRSETAAKARPGGRAKAFWLEVSSRSSPQSSKGDGHAAGRGDRIHQEQHIRIFFSHQRGHSPHIAHHPGAGFVVHDGHGVETARGQMLIDILRAHGLAPGQIDAHGIAAIGDGHLLPAVAKRAGDHVQHFAARADAIAHGRLLQAGAGGGEDVDMLFGQQNQLEFVDDAIEQFEKSALR